MPDSKATDNLRFVKLADIQPLPGTYVKDTPRKDYKDLIDSIKKSGLEKPVILRQGEKGEYQLVDGFHRCEALKQAGMLEVRADVYEMPLPEASRYRKEHRDKPDIPIIVSGSRGQGEDISEARCMADWLIGRGIEPERIWLEEQADNTQENIGYSLAMLAERGMDPAAAIAVVTSDYHLCRASMYMTGNMVPVAAALPVRYLPLTVNYYIREAFGVAEAIVFR